MTTCWIPKQGTVWLNSGDPTVQVDIPALCPICQGQLMVFVAGSDGEAGCLGAVDCDHWFGWEEVWKSLASVSNKTSTPFTQKAAPITKSVGTGLMGRCRGCGDQNPWAEVDDLKTNTYCCYSCRQSGYK